MSKKNYSEIIGAKAGFIIKYSRVFRLLVIIAYLFYLETLIVNVFSAVENIPTSDDIKGKFSLITAKTQVINSIEGYFVNKDNNLIKNLQKQSMNNPFMPYKTAEPNSVNGLIVPDNNVIN